MLYYIVRLTRNYIKSSYFVIGYLFIENIQISVVSFQLRILRVRRRQEIEPFSFHFRLVMRQLKSLFNSFKTFSLDLYLYRVYTFDSF